MIIVGSVMMNFNALKSLKNAIQKHKNYSNKNPNSKEIDYPK
jgi:hypothetical protein